MKKKTELLVSNNDTKQQVDKIKSILSIKESNCDLTKSSSFIKITTELENIAFTDFTSLSRESQAKILIKYSQTKKVLNKAKKYFHNNSDCTLDKENFQGILAETITKVLNKVEESQKLKKDHKKRSLKSLKTNDFEFKTVKEVFGYMTNAFENNVKKNYVPHKTQKRQYNAMISISPSDLNSDNFSHIENILPHKELMDDFIDQNFLKTVDKALLKYDSLNCSNLSKIFRELTVNDNHSQIAKSFKISNHQLSKMIAKIHDILQDQNLLEGLNMALQDQIARKESLFIMPGYKDSEKEDNANYSIKKLDYVHCIGVNYKTNKKEIQVSLYETSDYKKIKIGTESQFLSIDENQDVINNKIAEIKLNLQKQYANV